MPDYRYPLTLLAEIAAIQLTDSIAVHDNTGQLIVFARERILKPGQICIYRDRERKEQLFKTVPSHHDIGRRQAFTPTDGGSTVGMLTEYRERKTRRYEVGDANGKPLYTTRMNLDAYVRAAMRVLANGEPDSMSAVVFEDRRSEPVFQLQPIDDKGSLRLDLLDADIHRSHELRIILAVVALRVWWDRDNMMA